jgi:hypothetical protein
MPSAAMTSACVTLDEECLPVCRTGRRRNAFVALVEGNLAFVLMDEIAAIEVRPRDR